jgi:hypothetical protein
MKNRPPAFGNLRTDLAISKVHLHWMLLHDREVDLGFARLNAVSARANWKNCVVGRMTHGSSKWGSD